MLQLRGMYSWRLRVSVLDDLRGILAVTALASMAVLSLRILLPGDVDDLAPQSLRLLAFSAVYLAAGRVAYNWAQLNARRHGELAKPTLIVGAGRVGRLTANRLLEHRELGLVPVGFIDKEPLDEPGLPVPVLGASWDLEHLIEQHGIEHVVVTFSTAPSEVLLREIERCEQLGVSVSLVPRLFERMTERLTVDHLGGLPLLSAQRVDPKGLQFAVKYTVDRIVAGLFLLVLLPLFGLLVLGTLLSVGRPIFFRQPRFGLDGREFEMLKFRTRVSHWFRAGPDGLTMLIYGTRNERHVLVPALEQDRVARLGVIGRMRRWSTRRRTRSDGTDSPNRVSSGSRSPRSTARSTSTQASPRDSASVTACGLNDCAARNPRQPAFAGSARMKPR